MTEKKLVPKRRFEGFTSDWTVRNLGEILDLLKDGTHGTHRNVEAGIYLLSAKNIKNGKVNIDSTDRLISREEYEKIHRNFELRSGDILLTVVGSIGQAAILQRNIDFTFQRSVAYLRPNREIESNFLYTMVRSNYFQWELKNRQVVSAQPGIYLGDLSKIPIAFPVLKEQQKIGNFFKHLDQMISVEQHKLEKTKALKAAYLAEMFPAGGERVPKRRFPGFTGEWDEVKLKDISEIVGGGTPSSNIEEFWNGDIDWYSPTEIGNEIYANNSVRKITKIGYEKSSAKMLPADKTILFTSRAGIGSMAILKKQASTNQGFQSIVLKSGVDTYFIYSMGYLIKSYAISKSSGSTFLEISGKTLGEMPIVVPSFEEQLKIGEFFKKLDESITNNQQKLSKLKAMKQAYLEEMFV
ncbi:restriction endonuclease subunit S [Planococcus shenhongbingii]|uniref:Restriction endonuclease subunit S n=1 Tax=Planococcus shenhongbingii TaxID=3058398 RepID=A0ABT8NH68_9BACL|nr:restriction endonuclease subunit S [Planococcus sp. N017]MDN7247103.1 restriction endonuclease subunit S [Planococcus sp. N017]